MWKLEELCEIHSVVSDSLQPHGLYSPWNSLPTGVGSLSLLQGIFPTQGSNPGLPHCRQILYQFSHKGSLRMLEWIAYPFSRGSSWPRSGTGSPVLQEDSLPAELPGKPIRAIKKSKWIWAVLSVHLYYEMKYRRIHMKI